MEKWQQHSLGECLTLMSGGTPSKARNDFWGGDIPWVSCKDMKTERIHDAQDHLTPLGAKNGTRLVPTNTILFVVRGMILAREFPIAMTKHLVAFNQDLKAAKPAAFIDNEFLFQWLRANTYEILGRVDEAGHGTTRIQTDRLLSLPISVPPLPVQQRIAGILSAYDDLIENSQRRIKILEKMARSLYREWFVHFRFPGHENVPHVSSPLGEIPRGWEVKSIQQFGTVITGKTPSKANADFYGDDMPFVKTPDMHGNIFILGTSDCLSTAGAESQANKTLPAGSICVSCIGTIGVVSITTEDCQTNQQINSVVLANTISREFLFLRLQDSKQTLENLGANGATMGNVNKGKFEAMEIICPSDDVLAHYHRLVKPIFSEILSLFRQIQNLRRTRDLLLPRLLSGQIDVGSS
ncbi:type I restriction enzyme, S subunit [Gammaproteobacteria bacterium]